MNITLDLAERRFIPDPLVRVGIRNLLKQRLRTEQAHAQTAQDRWLRHMAEAPLAIATDKANAQHYEVPAQFYRYVLGPRLKYSGCYWPRGVTTLAQAEEEMLELYIERAQLADRQHILELGCGWGSLSLWLAERFPNASITGVSNSHSQRQFIMQTAEQRGLKNLKILTADMNEFNTTETFDRIVSVEMFEHMRNWQALLGRIQQWLRPDGQLFLHFFAHRAFVYPFEDKADDDWMGKHFFTGGMMPSRDLLQRIQQPLHVDDHWDVNGVHYARTAEAWLENIDTHQHEVLALFEQDMTRAQAKRMLQRWRMFFFACAELFGFANGQEWLVVHTRLTQKKEQLLCA